MTRDSFIMVMAGLFTGLFAYLYQLFMGIFLKPVEFGILFSLTSIVTVICVLAQSVQLSVAKFTSGCKAQKRFGAINYLWHFTLKQSFLIGVSLFILSAGLSPLLSQFLNLNNNFYPLIAFTSFILAFSLYGNWGIMQGLQRFPTLGISQVLWALLRLVFAILLIYLNLGLSGALAALPLSFAVAFIFTFFPLRNLSHLENEKVEIEGIRSYFGLTFLAIFGIAMLTNIDVVLAKHYLSPTDAGTYSAISVLGRIAFYAPAGVAIAMFPKTGGAFEIGGEPRRLFLKAGLLTLLIGGAICLAYALFSDFILYFLFSEKYSPAVPYLFKYGLGMYLFALAYLVMAYFLSLGKTNVAYALVGAMLLQIGLIALFHSNIAQLVNVMLICGGVSLVLLFLFYQGTKYI